MVYNFLFKLGFMPQFDYPESPSYYFAYGKNMNPTEIESRLGMVEIEGIAILIDYDIDFFKYSEKDDTGKANVIPKKDSHVEGVVYKLSTDQLKKLDKCEGCRTKHYKRKKIKILLSNQIDEITSYIYEAYPERIKYENSYGEPLSPSNEYLGHLITGAKVVGLSHEYIRRLEQTRTIKTKEERGNID